jgi:adenosyl cobinamide kinase/adenosyl cobinamide phosphate guanylyltransferase
MQGTPLILVLGGVRSGKSAVAEHLAAEFGAVVTYISTAEATDPDMTARIEAHRSRRDPSWATIEAGTDLPRHITNTSGPLLIDSLGTWVAAHPGLDPDCDALLAALVNRSDTCIVVSEEVGLSVHPPTPIGRRFQDVLGETNRRIADAADRVLLVVAGRVLELP